MFYEKLKEAKNENKIISIFINEENLDKFIVGKIINLDESEFIIELISPSGKYDGYRWNYIDKIIKIEEDGEYEKKIEKLYSLENTLIKEVDKKHETLLKSFLDFIKKEKFIVTIELFNSHEKDNCGFIESLENDILTLRNIDSYGQNDGISYININAITDIVCDSEEERIINKLINL